jgi:hypothetical protein
MKLRAIILKDAAIVMIDIDINLNLLRFEKCCILNDKTDRTTGNAYIQNVNLENKPMPPTIPITVGTKNVSIIDGM